jgi:TRAP-type C4-dicarboxylate transport system substrate-binding protein
MKMKARFLIAALALTFSGVVLADAPIWDELTDEQRVVLSQFEQNWNDLPAERRLRLSRGAERWALMSPRQRERAEFFNSLSPEEQARIRQNFKRFKEMKRERREMLRERYEQLTPEQRRELHERLDRQRGGRHGR